MKKIISFAFLIVALFGLSGCVEKDPLEKFIDLLEKEQNCEMEMEMVVPVFGTIRFNAELDENKMHMDAFLTMGETYTEEVDGVTYEYTLNESEQWVKTVQEEADDEGEFSTIEKLSYEDFIKNEDGTYTLKEEMNEDYGVSSLSIEITEDGAIMSMEMVQEGMTMEATITITNIGNVSVTLPEVQE